MRTEIYTRIVYPPDRMTTAQTQTNVFIHRHRHITVSVSHPLHLFRDDPRVLIRCRGRHRPLARLPSSRSHLRNKRVEIYRTPPRHPKGHPKLNPSDVGRSSLTLRGRAIISPFPRAYPTLSPPLPHVPPDLPTTSPSSPRHHPQVLSSSPPSTINPGDWRGLPHHQ